MKLIRTLLATTALLTMAGLSLAEEARPRTATHEATRASSAFMNFVGFPVCPFTLCAAEAAAPCPNQSADWQDGVIVECLKCWQLLCRKGRLAEAEQMANLMATLQPENPKVRAACTVTRMFQALAEQMAPENCPAAQPMPAGQFYPPASVASFTLPMPSAAGSAPIYICPTVSGTVTSACNEANRNSTCNSARGIAGSCAPVQHGTANRRALPAGKLTIDVCGTCSQTGGCCAKESCADCGEAGCCAKESCADCCVKTSAKGCACATKACACSTAKGCCCATKACACGSAKGCCCATKACACGSAKGCCCATKACACGSAKGCACATTECACCRCGSTKAVRTRNSVMFRNCPRDGMSPDVLMWGRSVVFPNPVPMPHPIQLPLAGPVMLPPPPFVLPPCVEEIAMPRSTGRGEVELLCPRRLLAQEVSRVRCTQESPIRPVAHNAQSVHLVTPHFDAHCERLRCAGSSDRLILEGNVCLTCNRDGRTMRIHAQRLLVNVREGTFAVESEGNQTLRTDRTTGVLQSGATSPTRLPMPCDE